MKDNEDVEKALAKLPKGHRELVKGFKVVFEPNNTLKGDKGHVGVIMTSPKRQIKVASPWNYGRGFCFLHEVGHLVWEKFMSDELRKKWKAICSRTKEKKKDEPPEELFCHAYANTYANQQIVIHTHPEWEKFIKNLPD